MRPNTILTAQHRVISIVAFLIAQNFGYLLHDKNYLVIRVTRTHVSKQTLIRNSPSLTFILHSLYLITQLPIKSAVIGFKSWPNTFLNGFRMFTEQSQNTEIDNRINTGVYPRNGFKIGCTRSYFDSIDGNEHLACIKVTENA